VIAEVPVDRLENVAVHRRITAAVSAAIAAAIAA
jgi:hypothetical protein